MKLYRNTTSYTARRRSRRGFTLVELIVVLTILAILAAIGVGSAIGYINRSKFEKNSQYAVTVYQAAQSALTQKVSNGRIDSFASNLLAIGDVQQEIPSNPRVTDETVHITVALTYNPKLYNPQPNDDQSNDDQSGNTQERDPQSVELYGLLNDYFYEKSIFSGTIGVVFDVTITADGNGIPQHSASVIATFYSLENYSTTEHWDSVRIGGNADEAPWNKLPNRNGAYRQGTSYVGFFDGTEASVIGSNEDGQPSGISSIVYFPAEEEVEQIDFLFTLRNAETLDVTWSLFDDTEHDAVFEIVFTNVATSTEVARIKVNEKTLLYNPSTNITGGVTDSGFLSDSPNVIYERVTKGRYTSWITRRSQEGLARVQISYDGGQNYNSYVVLPITVTSVSGDKQASYPTDIQNNGYISYTLSLDAMTTRSVYNSGSVNIPHSSVSLFGSNAINISASISGTYNAGTHFGSDNTSTYYATRAVNDPVYASNPGYDLWSETVRVGGETNYVVDHIVYCYTVSNSTNTLDSDGKCVVNTMFGDVICYNTPGDSTSNQSGNVSITSFRHLSNTRLVDSSVHFWIARDLNWYVHMHTVSPNNPSDIYASEVKSFISSGIYNCPVMNTEENRANNTCLRIVSFPALHELKTGQILSALGTCSINNVQLRKASFIFNKNSGDEGYGLICKNSGTIYNIYTNNLNLVITPVTDGSPCDYNSITCDRADGSIGSITVSSQENGWGDITTDCDRPVGGLVGLNASSIGLVNESDTTNTIRMSNTIVMANRYWTIWSNPNKNGTGGIVGKNESSVYGVLEVNGTFAVVGRDHVGGIIGWSYNDAIDKFNARLRVNQTAVSANTLVEIRLPAYGNADLSGNRMSCAVIAKNAAGSAVGCMQGTTLNYEYSAFTYAGNPETGVFSSINTDGYQFDVVLPADSLIYQFGTFNPTKDDEKVGAGGAIGCMKSCTGNCTSIQVNNDGYIIINDTTSNLYSGGAVGREYDSNISEIYVNVVNGADSKIGYYNSNSGPKCSGGAYGQIQSTATGRTIAINVVNEGLIVSRGLDSACGTGGAIGGVTQSCSITFAINVSNNSNQIICANTDTSYRYVDKWNGVGGAIGGIELDNSSLSADSAIYASNSNSNISGLYHVGGAVGNAPVNNGKIYAVNSNATITGVRFVGGAVGYDRDSQYGTIQATLTDTTITGEDYVGGSAGALHCYYNGGSVATIVNGGVSCVKTNGSGNGSLIGGVCGDIRVLDNGNTGHIRLNGNGTLTVVGGTESTGVGGAVGVLRAKNENVIARFSLPNQVDSSLIVNVEGHNDVGGVIGQVRSSDQGYTNKMSDSLGGTLGGFSFALYDFEVVLHPASHITATGSNVGGAIGHINAAKGSTYQRGISVSTASGTASAESGIRGISCVGGAVGRFDNSYPTLNDGSTIKVDFTAAAYPVTANPSTDGEDSNVGGAIGLLTGTTNKTYAAQFIEVNLGSSVISAAFTNASNDVIRGKNVGGAIGKTEVTNGTNALFANSISVTITGSGKIEGYNNVGGAIGYNGSVISGAVSSNISGSAVICGIQNIGGAVGCAGNSMSSVAATIACNNAIQGRNNLGGAIGKAEYGASFTIGSVTATINGAAYPITQTEELSTADDACIGGVIGFVSNKCTITSAKLNGTGGTVSLSSAQIPQILDGQVREYTGAMLISGKGRSIGGVIGSISGDSNNTKVYDISVETINICVVSTNGSQRVGGWIGSCFGRLGNTSSLTNYSVDTVKVVYSSSECVGGFCGTINQSGNTAAKLYANITVNLYGAIVTGRARVGGAFGDVYETDIESILTVNLHSETRIGDFNGNYEYGDTRGCICIDVGGAIGRFSVPSCVDSRSGLNPNKSTRVWVSIYENSMIFAGGSDDSGLEVTIDQAGVGGAFGRYGNPNTQSIYPNFADTDNATDPYISVYCASPYTTVYSKKSIIGGAVGHMYSGTISSSYSTAVVRTDGGSAAGGFIGSCESGYVHNCYSGGHTVGGQYISQFENVIGVDNVGGIIGYVGSGVGPNISGSNHAIQQCYSTCSVRGTTRVGGAFGWVNSSYSNMIHTVYCTGLVSSNPGSEYIGSYAGYVDNLNVFNKPGTKDTNKIVRANNIDLDRVGNFPESLGQVTDAMIYPAKWNGWGNDYIRIRDYNMSNYTAYPFDSTLGDTTEGTTAFPLRTFLSYTVGSVWHGTHYGDWPVIPNENVIDRSCIKIGDRDFGDLKIDDVAYNGPVTTLPDGLIEVRFGGAGGTLLVEGRDYTISYMYNDRLSTEGYPAYVIIAGVGDPAGTSGYWGSVTIPFNIVRRDISDTDISGITISPDDPAEYTYTGSEIRPVTISFNTGIAGADVITLVEGRDYNISYSDNINAGTAHVHITGIGNYTGEYDGVFTIAPRDISEATGISVAAAFYDGSELTPAVTITMTEGGEPLILGTDFTVTYTNNVEPRDKDAENPPTAHITGSGNYTGTVDVAFTIGKADIDGDTIEILIDPDTYTYTGSPIIPDPDTITITSDDVPLTRDTDYRIVSITENDAAGTASVNIEGIGDYTGTTTGHFTILDPVVTFDSDGGSTVEPQSVPYGEFANKPQDPTREGYNFAGWFISDEAEEPYDFEHTPVEDNIALKARWDRIHLTVTFDSMGGSSVDPEDILYGDCAVRPANDPTREMFIFAGWYTSEAHTTLFDFENTRITEDTIIYAYWTLDTSTPTPPPEPDDPVDPDPDPENPEDPDNPVPEEPENPETPDPENPTVDG